MLFRYKQHGLPKIEFFKIAKGVRKGSPGGTTKEHSRLQALDWLGVLVVEAVERILTYLQVVADLYADLR